MTTPIPPIPDTGPLETMARAISAEDTSSIGDAVRQASAVIDALTEAGYAIVPKEPTAAMIEAGVYSECGSGSLTLPDTVAASYRAMIAAAPSIDTKEGE